MHLGTNEFEIATAKTLPRCSTYFHNEFETLASKLEAYKNEKPEQLMSPLLPNTLRPMTLPTRGAASRVKKIELKGSNKANVVNIEIMELNNDNRKSLSCDGTASSPCESPSYMSNTFYNFPEKSQQQSKMPESVADTNPIPLPPREGKKHIKANPKRHVRKHPLIIPGNGVQRTLNKVTEASTTYDETTTDSLLPNSLRQKTFEVVASIRANPGLSRQPYGNAHSHSVKHIYQNMTMKPSSETFMSVDSASLHFESILEADFNKGNALQSPDVPDGFYNFSIQKEHYNKSKEVDFDSNQILGLYVNEDELRNLDIEKSLKANNTSNNNLSSISLPMATNSTSITEIHTAFKEDPCAVESEDHPPCEDFVYIRDKTKTNSNAEKDLAVNTLFQRERESVNKEILNKSTVNVKITSKSAQTQLTHNKQTAKLQTEAEYFAEKAARLADSNSVSCEDLLDFADKKPKGCERGVDSDEVRILMKVLGKDNVAPTRCLNVLEFIDWDVHKAIKIIKLQNILPFANLNSFESVEALQQYEWDLHVTALKLKGRLTWH